MDDLLDVKRVSRGRVELHRALVDARAVVGETCADHRALFDERSIALQVDAPSGPVWIDADAARISQVLGNLLQNAAHFSHEGGVVTLSVAEVGNEAEIRVRDEGAGIAAEILPQVFESFVQAERGLARSQGGLGLALVKEVVALHGGSVRAHSEGVDLGSEFVVALPLAAEPARLAGEPRPAPAATGCRVLVIEDNIDAGQTFAEVLELEGHRVHVATNGSMGIRMARELEPDVVLCDIGLPDVSGYDVARALRAEGSLRATRLIALTGHAQPEDRERATAAGFDAHLAKPAPLHELTALVAKRR